MNPVRPTNSNFFQFNKKHLRKIAAKHPESLLALIILSACGGGSSTEEEVVEVSYAGAVVKGPLQNATVFLDYDGDGVLGSMSHQLGRQKTARHV